MKRLEAWKAAPVLSTARAARTFARPVDQEIVRLTVANETIEVTDGHPFWVVAGQDLESRPWPEHVPIPPWQAQIPGRWVNSADLRIGDVLLLKDGGHAPISAIERFHFRGQVYNFQVEELESYAVGAGAVLVHNTSGDAGTSGGEGASGAPQGEPAAPLEPTRAGSGKNEPHGSPAGSSLHDQLAEYQRRLDELNRTQGSRREKNKLQQKIINLNKEIKRREKGETHGRRGKKGGRRCP